MEVLFNGVMLTGPTQSEHTGPIAFPWDRTLQIDDLVRADRPFVAARGNRKCPITFGCWRRYGSLLDAMLARVEFLDSLPDSGELEFIQYAGGSTLTIVTTAYFATTPEPKVSGRAVEFKFAFLATSFNTSVVVGEGIYQRNENGSIIRNEDGEPLLAE